MRKFDLSLRSSRSSYFATFRHQLTILSKTDALDEEKWLNMLGTFVNLPFKALMFLTLMRPSLVLFLVLWLKLVKDFLKVRCRLALLPFLISCLIWLDLVASLPLIKERILVIILLLHFLSLMLGSVLVLMLPLLVWL